MKEVLRIILFFGAIISCSENNKMGNDISSDMKNMMKIYPDYIDTVIYSPLSYQLYNFKNNKVFESLIFDSNQTYFQYVFYSEAENPIYSLILDSAKNILAEEGVPVNIYLPQCINKNNIELFSILPPTPPFFKVSLDIFTKEPGEFSYSKKSKYVFKDDKALSYCDTNFIGPTDYRLILKKEFNQNILVDTFHFTLNSCAW